MGYMVDGGTNNRPIFATLEEASSIANLVARETGDILCVTKVNREATHELRIDSQTLV